MKSFRNVEHQRKFIQRIRRILNEFNMDVHVVHFTNLAIEDNKLIKPAVEIQIHALSKLGDRKLK